ncbi:conserved hypothetical protein [Xanthomonas citri pv. citri]|nr:conserved hypothetical protein [Xanthomonas citri pv. citri]
MRAESVTDENAAELDALRERIAADGRWWRAVIGFASLIRERLVTPGLSRREYADGLAFLRIELAADAALIEYGVGDAELRHTVGIVAARWTGNGLEDVRGWEEGQPCELASAWSWIERGALDEMP